MPSIVDPNAVHAVSSYHRLPPGTLLMYRTLLFLMVFLVLALPSGAQDAPREPFSIGRGAVIDAAWSPSGTHVLVNTVRGAWIYDDQLRDVAQLPLRHAVYSPDGRYLAGIDPTHRAVVHDARTFEHLETLDVGDLRIAVLAWHPDSLRLAVSTVPPTYYRLIWTVGTGEPPLYAFGGLASVEALQWNPAGTRLAGVAPLDQYVLVWSFEHESPRMTTIRLASFVSNPVHIEWVDNDHLVAGVIEEDIMLHLYDARDGEKVYPGRALVGGLPPRLSPDGQHILDAGRVIRMVPVHSLLDEPFLNPAMDVPAIESEADSPWYPSAMRWTPDGDGIVVAAERYDSYDERLFGQLWRVSAADGRVIQRVPLDVPARDVIPHPSGESVLVIGVDNSLARVVSSRPGYPRARWRLVAASVAHVTLSPALKPVAWSPDGSTIAIGEPYGFSLWDASSGDLIRAYRAPDTDHPAIVRLRWRPNGRYLIVSNSNGNYMSRPGVWLYDTAAADDAPSYRFNPSLTDQANTVRAIDWHPSGSEVVVAMDNNTLAQIYAFGEAHWTRQVDAGAYVYDAAWSPDGAHLMLSVSMAREWLTVIWDEKAQQIVEPKIPVSFDLPRAWTEDGRVVGIGMMTGFMRHSPYLISLHTLTPGAELDSSQLSLDQGVYHNVIFSPDGQRGAVLTSEGSVTIYDMIEHRTVSTLSRTSTLSWSADRRLAILRHDGQLWIATRDGLVLRRYDAIWAQNHSRYGWYDILYWSPDGTQIAVAFGGVVTGLESGLDAGHREHCRGDHHADQRADEDLRGRVPVEAQPRRGHQHQDRDHEQQGGQAERIDRADHRRGRAHRVHAHLPHERDGGKDGELNDGAEGQHGDHGRRAERAQRPPRDGRGQQRHHEGLEAFLTDGHVQIADAAALHHDADIDHRDDADQRDIDQRPHDGLRGRIRRLKGDREGQRPP
jgi:WD40 repeat protein